MKRIQNGPMLQDKYITGEIAQDFLCIQWVEAFSMLEAQNMTQNSSAHLYDEGDTIHLCQINRVWAQGVLVEESSKGTLVSAHLPTLESLVRNYA